MSVLAGSKCTLVISFTAVRMQKQWQIFKGYNYGIDKAISAMAIEMRISVMVSATFKFAGAGIDKLSLSLRCGESNG